MFVSGLICRLRSASISWEACFAVVTPDRRFLFVLSFLGGSQAAVRLLGLAIYIANLMSEFGFDAQTEFHF